LIDNKIVVRVVAILQIHIVRWFAVNEGTTIIPDIEFHAASLQSLNCKYSCRYYAPALGFLMFAVGVNSNENDFIEAFKRPAEIATGYFGQFFVKPLLGYLFCLIAVTALGLPTTVGEVAVS